MRLIDFDAKIQKNADYNDGISIFFCTFAAVYEEDCINNISFCFTMRGCIIIEVWLIV